MLACDLLKTVTGPAATSWVLQQVILSLKKRSFFKSHLYSFKNIFATVVGSYKPLDLTECRKCEYCVFSITFTMRLLLALSCF